MTDRLAAAREAFVDRRWAEAHANFLKADDEALGLDDLEDLAVAAHLVADTDTSDRAWERAHREALDNDEPARAARLAWWLGLDLILRGEEARAGGWFGRCGRLLEEHQLKTAEAGFLLVPTSLRRLHGGDAEGALEGFGAAARIARQFHEPDLMALSLLGTGQALVSLGRIEEGVSSLDDVMVDVLGGGVSPIVSGIVYCAVIDACRSVFDLGRAREWTTALTKWCEQQPDMVPYAGQCLVHRAELLQLSGSWDEAVVQADLAVARLSDPPGQPPLGAAAYQRAELHRVAGEFDQAEAAYREASRFGREPQPGLALMRLAQGDAQAAAASVRRSADAHQELAGRSRSLAAQVEIVLELGEVEEAAAAADRLTALAEEADAPILWAMALGAQGLVRLARGELREADRALRDSLDRWRQIEAPYELARTSFALGLVARELGDQDGASMMMEAARDAFEGLGARPDLEHVLAELRGGPQASAPAGLTGRELEVLGHLAKGKTNRQIATDLVISEKTVARHVSNIFLKINVSSRSAATAYAFQHDLA